ncbi:MAG: nickel pincer cofactor biosynthesis protein LarC [Candidatus Omnitrophica bacterium]|nr:nickel pincer cofactor biosynthesis protein LarC [Candidatus Omnitrophota bacterium]
MKIAVFDLIGGISGDMTVGAFLDAGLKDKTGKKLDLKWLKKELGRLRLRGYSLSSHRTLRGGIRGTKFDVDTASRHHEYHGHGMSWREIRSAISKSALPEPVRSLSEKILHNVALAEAKIHRKPVDKIHFHEVGAVDSIVDVVAFALFYHAAGIEKVYVRNISLGHGHVHSQHGDLPLPAPASLELLKGFPVKFAHHQGERVTPTGAAFLKTVAERSEVIPVIEVESIGYGAGYHDRPGYPNVLRLAIGDAERKASSGDRVLLLETNIDDMRPLEFELVYERLLGEGALDVFVLPIFMKKMRPAHKLSVLVPYEKLEGVKRAIFEETPTLGVRIFELDRAILERKKKFIRSRYGPVSVTVGTFDGKTVVVSPEYKDCKKIALKKKVPLRRVYEEVKRTVVRE